MHNVRKAIPKVGRLELRTDVEVIVVVLRSAGCRQVGGKLHTYGWPSSFLGHGAAQVEPVVCECGAKGV